MHSYQKSRFNKRFFYFLFSRYTYYLTLFATTQYYTYIKANKMFLYDIVLRERFRSLTLTLIVLIKIMPKMPSSAFYLLIIIPTLCLEQ